MAKQEILEILSCDESAGEDTATLGPAAGEMTGSGSEAGGVVEQNSSASSKAMSKVTQSTKKPPASVPVLMRETSETSSGDAESREKVAADIPIDDAESENESSSSDEEEEEGEQTETSEEPSNKFGNTRAVGASEVEITKRKREEEDGDGSGSTGDESGESDAGAGPSSKRRRKSTAKEEVVPTLTPPPTPGKSKAKQDIKGSGGKDGVAGVEDTDADEGGGKGGPQPKPKRGGTKKEASTIVVKASSSSHAKFRPPTRKIIKKDPKARGHGGVAPRGQSESAEGSITAGEIGIIFETLTAEADWAAVVAKTNALVGLKRLGRNVSRHWKTVAKKRLLDAYGA